MKRQQRLEEARVEEAAAVQEAPVQANEEVATLAPQEAVAAAAGVVAQPVQQQIACQQMELQEVRAELERRCNEAAQLHAKLDEQWQLLSDCQHHQWQHNQH